MNEHRSALEDLSAALIVCPNNTQTRKALCRLGVETTDTMQASLNRFTTIEKRLTHAAQLAGMQPIPNNFPECVSGGGGQRRLHGSATARTRMRTARDESTPFTVRVATSSAATAKVRMASESSSSSTRSRRRRLRKQAPAREPARDGRAQQQWSRGVATLHIAAALASGRDVQPRGGNRSSRFSKTVQVPQWGITRPAQSTRRRRKAQGVASPLAPLMRVLRARTSISQESMDRIHSESYVDR